MSSPDSKTPHGFRIDRLSVSRVGVRIIENLSLSLPASASLALVGESGCGKSTLLEAIAGLIEVDEGRIFWGDSAESGEQTRPRSAFVWQHLALFPWKTVEENLRLPLLLEKRPKDEERAAVAAMLKELGLEGLERRFPAELSGGQRQRLALGRALIASPELLFMDEPFSALDALRRERLQDFLDDMRSRRRLNIVFVTHDVGEAVFLASHILMLAAKPFRVLGFLENPLYLDEALRSAPAAERRESETFYETVRAVHAALRRASTERTVDKPIVLREEARR